MSLTCASVGQAPQHGAIAECTRDELRVGAARLAVHRAAMRVYHVCDHDT
jgi:hypothetical protein